MPQSVLQLDPRDNVLVALAPLSAGDVAAWGDESCTVTQAVAAKHKMAIVDLAPGDLIRMYGMVVGEATAAIPRGGVISTRNVRHRAEEYTATRRPGSFALPDASAWTQRTFMGFHRADGQVGTRNYWLVLPLVFCENRNVERMKEALEEELGYGGAQNSYRNYVRGLVRNAPVETATPPSMQNLPVRSGSSPTSTAYAFLRTRAAAAARARTRRRSAACWRGTFTTPTLQAQQC